MNQTEKIKKQRDFAAVLAHGTAWSASATKSAQTIRLIARPNRLTISRCGFITSKRLGKAVTRNRVRRRLRESMRMHYPHVQPGMDLVFIARRGAVRISFWELDRHVCAALKRAELLPAEYRPSRS